MCCFLEFPAVSQQLAFPEELLASSSAQARPLLLHSCILSQHNLAVSVNLKMGLTSCMHAHQSLTRLPTVHLLLYCGLYDLDISRCGVACGTALQAIFWSGQVRSQRIRLLRHLMANTVLYGSRGGAARCSGRYQCLDIE